MGPKFRPKNSLKIAPNFKPKFLLNCHPVFEYIREARMTPVAFMSQVGGLMGLCLGFSFLSVVELMYWVTFRMARNT